MMCDRPGDRAGLHKMHESVDVVDVVGVIAGRCHPLHVGH
jgi:hypothetical protein